MGFHVPSPHLLFTLFIVVIGCMSQQNTNDISDIDPKCFEAIAEQETGRQNCVCKLDGLDSTPAVSTNRRASTGPSAHR